MSVQDVLNMMCEECQAEVQAVFTADPRPAPVIITGDRHHATCCFVADEIRFLDGGRLIFDPAERQGKEYCRIYFVVCRKLVIVEGGEPLGFDPCGTEDPDGAYKGRNVITWKERLITAADGPPPNPDQAATGSPDFDRNVWIDQGQGNSGNAGGPGVNGVAGNPGSNGRFAPEIAVIALEVEFMGLSAYLTIDADGQVGGDGGRGQHGGTGGEGMGGRNSVSDNTWPGEGCDREAGNGGDGGKQGDGGTGGKGGDGGNAGKIHIISTQENVTTGAFVSGQIGYVNDGGNEGAGGLGGFGEPANPALLSRGGRGGHGGPQCEPGVDGDAGAPGWPPRVPLAQGSDVNKGPDGAPGAAASIDLYEIVSHPCTDPIPLPTKLISATPDKLCRGFSSPENNLPLILDGEHLAQVTNVTFSLAGVTATILPTSDDLHLDLLVDITGASGTGACTINLERAFGPTESHVGLLSVGRFEVLSVAPASGDQGQVTAVTITGTCFDPGAVVQQVSVSGVGTNVNNIVVLNDTTITCEFDVTNVATLGQKDVTVQTGAFSHTKLNAFLVTP